MLKLANNYINDNYGSRRGLINSSKEQFLLWLGEYRLFQAVDWRRVDRLVFICHGNICRSPLAEVYAHQLGVSALSFGLNCRNDAPADPRAVKYASKINLDLSGHRTQNIKLFKVQSSDLLIVMEPIHLLSMPDEISRLAQVTLAGLWLSRPSPYIHDPFNANDSFFTRCEDMVISSAKALANKLMQWKS